MRLLTVLLVVIGVTVSRARPQTGQDVDNGDNGEFVTTDNPETVNIGDSDLELAGEGGKREISYCNIRLFLCF